MVQSTIQFKCCHKKFPPHNTFHKIFNRNPVKIGYICMPNIKTTINSHNHKTTNLKTKERIFNYIQENTHSARTASFIYKAVLAHTNSHYKEKI